MAKFGESGDLVKCSFCGKTQQEVAKLVVGPDVYIGNECIDLCNEVLSESGIDSTSTETPPARRGSVLAGAEAGTAAGPDTSSPAGFLCRPCMLGGTVRRAWTLTAGDATCVRHAIISSDLDEAGRDELLAVIYDRLGHLGVTDPH